ncbi:MAG TPA: ATP-binding protein [Usitatibacter sp.]|nr:ATP-binding protein [Usitatibacter sp.]
MNRTTRGASQALGAAFLLAMLVFLFVKTAGVDVKHDTHALSLLRELKDLDGRWDEDVLRMTNDFSGAAPRADFPVLMGRILGELEHSGPGTALARDLAQLRAGLADKDAAARSLRDMHQRAQDAVQAMDTSVLQLQQLAEARGAKGAVVASLVNQVRADAAQPLDTLAGRAPAMQQRIATLRPASLAIDPLLGEAAGRAETTSRAFLAAREGELSLWSRYSFLTLGARTDLALRALSASIEGTLDEKDRWRAYLFAYALALLIATGYLASRVASTQAQLRSANESLEKRVAERTRDLSTTLQRLQESEAQLVQSEKMSSLGQMVAGVAHEMNSPLAYVKNSVATARDRMPDLRDALAGAARLLDILRSDAPDPGELQASFDALESQLGKLRREHVLEDLDALTRDGLHGIEQIVELVANLRNFSRLDRSKVASFNVNEGVRATLLIAKPALRKVDVERKLGDIPSITCSPSQVNQVLLNLVTNAAQAMDKPRGRITVITREGSPGTVAIEVDDNGKGISEESLPKIFDPFYTTKDVGKGTGLGLTIAYKIVKQHGGHIDVRSTLGEGTTVIVTLPVEPPADLAMNAESAPEAVNA